MLTSLPDISFSKSVAFILFIYAFVVFFVIGFIFIKRSIKYQLNKKKGLKESAYEDALKILDKARADSLKILGSAEVKAQSVLNNTNVIDKENREKLENSLKIIYQKQEKSIASLTEELINTYKDTVSKGKQENIKTLYEVTEGMKKEALSSVEEFKNVLQKETLGAQSELEKRIQDQYQKIEEEIRTYKTERLKNLHSKIFDILANVSSEVIKQDLDQIKHEKLILALLSEEIKKSGIVKSDISENILVQGNSKL